MQQVLLNEFCQVAIHMPTDWKAVEVSASAQDPFLRFECALDSLAGVRREPRKRWLDKFLGIWPVQDAFREITRCIDHFIMRINYPAAISSCRHDLIVGFGFVFANVVAHLCWHLLDRYWEVLVSTFVLTAVLTVWLVREWRGLKGFMTRFYCSIALLDLLAEGLLQPVHHCTQDNLLCSGRLFLVFLGFWLVLQPLEQRLFRRALLLLPLLIPIFPSAASTNGTLICTSLERQTTLLELFTSEGCNSCPPAEAWLSRLVDHPKLWKEFVPVAFHVDYWDHLGWKDRFALPQFTQRQQAYVAGWQRSGLYTPAFVANGREAGSTGRAKLLEQTNATPGVLAVECLEKSVYAVRFTPAVGMTGPFDAHVAWLECGVTMNIARGENAGHELRHDFLVRRWETAPLRITDGVVAAQMTGPDLLANQDGTRNALAVWVTRHGAATPLQSTGGWLTVKRIQVFNSPAPKTGSGGHGAGDGTN